LKIIQGDILPATVFLAIQHGVLTIHPEIIIIHPKHLDEAIHQVVVKTTGLIHNPAIVTTEIVLPNRAEAQKAIVHQRDHLAVLHLPRKAVQVLLEMVEAVAVAAVEAVHLVLPVIQVVVVEAIEGKNVNNYYFESINLDCHQVI
jgi:hypothetical protein